MEQKRTIMEKSETNITTSIPPPVKVISDRGSGDIIINYNITIICQDQVDTLRANERQRIHDIFSRRGGIICE